MSVNLESPAQNKHSTLARLVASQLRAPRASGGEEDRGQGAHNSMEMGRSHCRSPSRFVIEMSGRVGRAKWEAHQVTQNEAPRPEAEVSGRLPRGGLLREVAPAGGVAL